MKQVLHVAALLALLAGAFPASAASQAPPAPVTMADIDALQVRVDDLRELVLDLPPGDVGVQDRLRLELDDVYDEAVYLKVKLRKQGVAPSEFADLRSRVDAIEESVRQRRAMAGPGDETARDAPTPSAPRPPAPPTPATSAPPPPPAPVTMSTPPGPPGAVPIPPAPPEPAGATPPSPPTVVSTPPAPPEPAWSAPPAPPVASPDPYRTAPPPTYSPGPAPRADAARATGTSGGGEIPVGQQLDVRVQSPLSSATAQVEDRFEATTLVDLYEGPRLLVPAGSLMRGVVSSVEKSGRLDRKGSLTLTFDQLTVRGVDYPVRATVTQTLESPGVKKELSKIGVGAGMGAMIGGMIAGPQGAAAGVFIGAGGALFAVPGKDVHLPSGAILRVRFDTPVVVQ
jgi:hypothetical protein